MSYETIFWLGLAILTTAWAGAAAIGVVFAWRLHRKTSRDPQAVRKSAKRGVRLTDHRYDRKQFRRR